MPSAELSTVGGILVYATDQNHLYAILEPKPVLKKNYCNCCCGMVWFFSSVQLTKIKHMTKTKDIVPPTTPKHKTALEILREEKEKFTAKIQQQKDAILFEFQNTLKSAGELLDGLKQECQITNAELLRLPVVSEFLGNFEATPEKADSGPRVKSADLLAAIKTALDGKELTHAELQAAPSIVAVYSAVGKPVPKLFLKLDKLVEEKTLVKNGVKKNAKYSLVK